MRDPQTPPEKAEMLHSLDKQAARGTLDKVGFIKQAAALLNRSAEEVDRQFFHSTNRNQVLMNFAQHARETYKTALLSNIGSDMMDGFFTPEERKTLFDVVILSGDVKLAKPDPEIFELTLQNLGVAPQEAIFIDDSENHIVGAQKLGIRSIQFSSNNQLKNELQAMGINQQLANLLQ